MIWTIPALVLGLVAADTPVVEVVETPGGGVQPQAVVDAEGVVHLVYLKGEPDGSDVYYSSRKPGLSVFETPIQVNSGLGKGIAVGTVRGARIAVGRGGRVHVAWNGGRDARPENPSGGSPLLYARSDLARTRFEPPRNLMTRTTGLDGGGTIAAGVDGDVYVAWHGQPRGSVGEANRRIWVARSTDDGATFSGEEPATDQPTGACGCCGTGSLVDSKGSSYVLYRAATQGIERGMILLTSRAKGGRYEPTNLDAWKINACPMSTATMIEGASGLLAAWENRGQVAYTRVDRDPGERTTPTSPSGSGGSRKHPALAVNRKGEILLAWTEDTGWKKGGSLAWQVFDPSGRPIGPPGRVERAIPVWGLATVVARPDGGFTIFR